jgi:hypothetical protein
MSEARYPLPLDMLQDKVHEESCHAVPSFTWAQILRRWLRMTIRLIFPQVGHGDPFEESQDIGL